MRDSGDDLVDTREEIVDAAIAEYLRAAGGDEPFAVDEWLARHPGAADELAEFLRDEGVFGQLAAPLLPPGGRAADPGATIPAAGVPGPVFTGRSVGDYEVLGEIAEGGMGVVYRARQRAVNRVVALKMVRGAQASPREADRLRREAEAVAGLDHPNIVPLYEVGEHDGRPFFAMKLIAGGSLAERLPALSGRYREAVALVATVARAIDHAHRRGILHRDLKPSNILVDGGGAPHVTDFGLARRLEGEASASGAVTGTPAYMAPEQARGEKGLTTAVDVYGLGAVLYALLTGGPPFRAESVGQTLLLVMTAEPVAPRAADPRVPRDLEAVCLKCLSKEPTARYRSAAALADDLDRWLNGEPVSARPVGAVRRAARWVRRNKGPAALAAVTGLLLVTLLGGAWWRQTERLREELAEEKRAGEERKRLAEERTRRVRVAEAGGVSVGACEQALKAGRADRATPALAEADRRMLEGGAEELRERVERCRADLAVLRDLDEVDTIRWAPVRNKTAKFRKVVEGWRAAFKKFGVTPGETPADEAARLVTESHVRNRLLTALDLWLLAEPSPAVRRLLTLVDANGYRESVRDAVVARDGAAQAELAGLAGALAQPPRFAAALGQNSAVPVGRRREVLEVALRARPDDLTLLMSLGELDPIDRREGADRRVRWFQAAVAAHPEFAAAHNSLGVALYDWGDRDGAIACYREAVRLDPRDALAYSNLGADLCEKDVDAAIAYCREAIRLDPQFAPPHNHLGSALRIRGDLDGAVVAHKAALRLDPADARAHNNLGVALYYRKDFDVAIACYKEALRLDPVSAAIHDNLGRAQYDKGDVESALISCKAALRLDPAYARAHNTLGGVLYHRKFLDAAIACYKEAIRLDPVYAPAHFNLGMALKDLDLDAAGACFREAIRLDPLYAGAHHYLGNVLRLTGDPHRAIASYKTAIRLGEAGVHSNLGVALKDKGDLDGAIDCYREALRLDPNSDAAYSNLGVALALKGEPDRAIVFFKATIRLQPSNADFHHNVGLALRDKGDLDGAASCFKEAIRIARKAGHQQNLDQVDRWRTLLPRLPEVAAGRARPADPDVACEFAYLCGQPFQKRYATGVVLYSAAFKADPTLAPYLQYDAARQALLASAGRGTDMVAFGVEEWGELTDRARAWLRADLRRWTELAKNPAVRSAVRGNLARWRWDPALAPVRDAAWLAVMPPTDRKAWEAFWADVDAVLATTTPTAAGQTPAKP